MFGDRHRSDALTRVSARSARPTQAPVAAKTRCTLYAGERPGCPSPVLSPAREQSSSSLDTVDPWVLCACIWVGKGQSRWLDRGSSRDEDFPCLSASPSNIVPATASQALLGPTGTFLDLEESIDLTGPRLDAKGAVDFLKDSQPHSKFRACTSSRMLCACSSHPCHFLGRLCSSFHFW